MSCTFTQARLYGTSGASKVMRRVRPGTISVDWEHASPTTS